MQPIGLSEEHLKSYDVGRALFGVFPLKNIDRHSFQMANLLVSWDLPLPQLLRFFCLVVEIKIRYSIKSISPNCRFDVA